MLRSRESGSRQYVAQPGYRFLESIEAEIRIGMPCVVVFTQPDSLNDPILRENKKTDRTVRSPDKRSAGYSSTNSTGQ